MKNRILILILLTSATNHFCQFEKELSISHKRSESIANSDSNIVFPDKKETWLKFNFGYKFPNTDKYGLEIEGGPWLGVGLNFGLSENLSIQPELNLWKGKEVAPTFNLNLTTLELLTFLSYDKLLKNYHVRPYAGLGLGTVNRGGVNESIISFNLGTSYRIMIIRTILELNLRYQSAGSNNIAGGSGYQSWFLGLSYGFPI